MIVGGKSGDCYQISVKDYVVNEIDNGDGTTSKSFSLCKEKSMQIPIATINGLFELVSADIPAETPYSEREDLARELAFLVYVKNDIIASTGKLIYQLEPQDFEIYRG